MSPRRGTLWFVGLFLLAAVARPAHSGDSALVTFQGLTVPPVGRGETARVIDAGVVDTEGYKEVVLSIGGEMKETAQRGGRIGAILIPEDDLFDFVRRNEGMYAFPIEVTAAVEPDGGEIFLGKQSVGRVAFPRYRVLLYNSTDRTATVSVFVYRSR